VSLAEQQRQALHVLAGFVTADEPLAPHTTYKLGGPAAVFATPRTVEQLTLVGEAMRVSRLPVLVVGRGSNLLVADSGFPGIAVSLAELADTVQIDGTIVVAGSAVALPVLARRTAAMGLTGFEWAVGVPGSIGGAVRMNAGGHGSDMAAVLRRVQLFDLHTGHHGSVEASRLHLRFRGSELGDHQVVLDATLELEHGDAATAEATLAEIVKWRREHQPGGQNAGSVFVNPVPGGGPTDRQPRISWLRHRRRAGEREARQFHPGHGRGHRLRRACGHRARSRRSVRGDRIPAAQ
jgi:UDP-N-acetylmuramate dehydrogenase